MTACFNEQYKLGSHTTNGALLRNWFLQDNAASSTVADNSATADAGATSDASNTSTHSATGPNSWLTKALSFGSGWYINSLLVPVSGTAAWTVRCRFKTTSAAGSLSNYILSWGDAVAGKQFNISVESGVLWSRNSSNTASGSSGKNDGNWHNWTLKKPAGVGVSGLVSRCDKSSVSLTTSGSDSINLATTNTPTIGVYFNGSTAPFSGSLADISILNYQTTSAEDDEWEDGPEPINSSAPTQSGSATVGAAQSCTTGTWGLVSPFAGGSNGTITYSYQWTASTDGSGTGETNISGATSSTYTPVSGDVGKYLRCWVRASNNGGYDAAADTPTAFSGPIAASGGSVRNRGIRSGGNMSGQRVGIYTGSRL